MAVTPSLQEPTVGGEVRTAAQVLAAVLGLAGYVYLIGGVVSWVRFGAARLAVMSPGLQRLRAAQLLAQSSMAPGE